MLQEQSSIRREMDSSSGWRQFARSLEYNDLVSLLGQCNASTQARDSSATDDDGQITCHVVSVSERYFAPNVVNRSSYVGSYLQRQLIASLI